MISALCCTAARPVLALLRHSQTSLTRLLAATERTYEGLDQIDKKN
jgi:hypothetical protein